MKKESSISIGPSPEVSRVKAVKAHETKCAGLLSIKSANDWIEESLKTPDPKKYFHDLIIEYENTVLFAASNVGKSILAVQIAEEIAKTEKVLYVDLELSSKQFQMRYCDIQAGRFHVFPANFSRAEIDPNLMLGVNIEQEIIDSIEKAAKKGTKFFIIDNITFLCSGAESGTKAANFMKQLVRLKKKYGLTNIVIAHTPKRRGWKPITQNDLAGSAKLMNFFDAAIALARSANDNNLRYLKQVKVRTGEFIYDAENVLILDISREDGALKFDVMGCGVEEDHLSALGGSEVANEVLEMLMMQRDGMSVRQIAEAMNTSKSKVGRLLKEANDSNLTVPESPDSVVPVVPTTGHSGRMESAGHTL